MEHICSEAIVTSLLLDLYFLSVDVIAVQVTLSNGKQYIARVVGIDGEKDVAVLKLNDAELVRHSAIVIQSKAIPLRDPFLAKDTGMHCT